MDEYINNLISKLNPNIKNFIEEFDLDFEIKDYSHKDGYEIKHNKLLVWHFDVGITSKDLCEILLQNPQIDTLFLGKGVTDNNDGRQIRMIHYFLTSSHNIIPIINNIELEDESNYYVVDGMLIDKKMYSVIDYASGRKNKSIHVPDGIIGLKEHCFNYNEYVERIEIL